MTPANLQTPSLWRVITADGQRPTAAAAASGSKKAFKIRVYPTREQDAKLKQWFGAARWTYNQCVQSLKSKACSMTKKALRALHVNNEALQDRAEWAQETPLRHPRRSNELLAESTKSHTRKKKWSEV